MTTVLERIKSLTDVERYRFYSHFLKIKPINWQLTDWQAADEQTEACFCRSRGGSKTFDFVNWVILRVITTGERWVWLASKQGQLDQARLYFRKNKFVQKITRTRVRDEVLLWTGDLILLGIVSTSNLGLRLDGVIIDEEEDLEPKQAQEIYPQMAGMLSTSPIHKFFHLGTRWIGTVFDENCDKLPTFIHPWGECPWIDRTFIEKQIKTRPDWEIKLLYECERTVPGGSVFPNITKDWTPPHPGLRIQYGIDCNSGSLAIVGVVLDGERIYVCEEWQIDYNHPPTFLRGYQTEVEDGGFNSKPADEIQRMYGAIKQTWTSDAKSARMYQARPCQLIFSPKCPRTLKDVESCQFDPKNGLYLKDRAHPNHWTDAFLHAIRRYTTVPIHFYGTEREGPKVAENPFAK